MIVRAKEVTAHQIWDFCFVGSVDDLGAAVKYTVGNESLYLLLIRILDTIAIFKGEAQLPVSKFESDTIKPNFYVYCGDGLYFGDSEYSTKLKAQPSVLVDLASTKAMIAYKALTKADIDGILATASPKKGQTLAILDLLISVNYNYNF